MASQLKYHPYFAHSRDRLVDLYRRSLRFLLPVDCTACGRSLDTDPVPFFCRTCWDRIVPFRGPTCARCGQSFVSAAATSVTPNHCCQRCLLRPPAYERASTLFPYITPLREAICLFKYGGKVAMTRALVDLMAQALPTQLDVDLLMPVPLHPSRLRAREFNQSLLLADRLGRQLNCQVSPSNLVRISATEPQTTLSRPARLRNLRKAFDLRNAHEVAGRRVLLVDDVYTTGTTVNECAKVLKRSGVESVMVLTLARTVDASLIPDRHFAESSDPIMTLVGP